MRRFGVLVGLALTVVACSGSEADPTTTTAGGTTSTTRPAPTTTTTTIPPGLIEATVEALSGDTADMVLRFAVEAASEDGSVRRMGESHLGAGDRAAWHVTDFSQLVAPKIDGLGRVLGPGGLEVASESVRIVDGTGYRRVDGGNWFLVDPVETIPYSDLPGALSGVSYEGPEPTEVDGERLWELTAEAMTGAEADGFGFMTDGDIETVDVSLVVDGDGRPRGADVLLRSNGQDGAQTVVEAHVMFRSLDRPIAEAPTHWVSGSSLGFGVDTGDIVLSGVIDFDLPSTWEVIEEDAGIIRLETPRGAVVSFLAFADEYETSADLMDDFLDVLGIEAESFDVPFARFEGQVARDLSDEHGFSQAYAEFAGAVAFVAFWSAPGDDTDIQTQTFNDVLQTVRWSNGLADDGLNGHSLGDELLISDALPIVTVFASVAGDCEGTAIPVWSEIEGGTPTQWTENWYFDACGSLVVQKVDFSTARNGGTNFHTSNESRVIGPDNPWRPSPMTATDHALRLSERPWFVDPALGVSELDIAALVVEANQMECRFSALLMAGNTTDEWQEELEWAVGTGTLMWMDDEYVGYVRNSFCFTEEQTLAALDAATAALTYEESVEGFITELIWR